MKEFILDPLNISIIFISLLSYAVVVYKLANKYRASANICFSIIILFFITDINIGLLRFIHPSYLGPEAFNRNILSIFLQLTIYAFLVYVFHTSWFNGFIKNSFYLAKDYFLGALLIVSVISFLWSETPVLTLRSSLVVIVFTLVGIHFGRKFNLQQQERLIRINTILIILLSILFSLFIPSIGMANKGWRGVFPVANWLGSFAAFSASLWLFRSINIEKDRILSLCMFLISSVTVIKANSSTGIIALFTLSILVLSLSFLKKFNIYWSTVILLGYVCISIYSLTWIQDNLDVVLGWVGKDATFNGRTSIWTQIFERIHERPLLGYGYGGFWQPWRNEDNPANGIFLGRNVEISRSHNGLVELILDLGYVGLSLFLAAFSNTIVRALKKLPASRQSFEEASFAIITLTFIFVTNFSQDILFSTNYRWLYFVMISTNLNTTFGSKPAEFLGKYLAYRKHT